jgi:hypothetical protein
MTQIVLDDQLDVHAVLHPIQQWTTAHLLRELRPGEHVLDERVPELLQRLKQPTFITIDHGFWDRRLCHPRYGILYFALRKDQQALLPGLLRALMRLSEFRTRAGRMGIVARVSTSHIEYCQFQKTGLQQVSWSGPTRQK